MKIVEKFYVVTLAEFGRLCISYRKNNNDDSNNNKKSDNRSSNCSGNRSAKSSDATAKLQLAIHVEKKKTQWSQYRIQKDGLSLENGCLRAELTAIGVPVSAVVFFFLCVFFFFWGG